MAPIDDDNVPEVGEVIAFWLDDTTSVFAVVEAAVYWDLVTCRLLTGETVYDVRRVVQWIDDRGRVITESPRGGRFSRIDASKKK